MIENIFLQISVLLGITVSIAFVVRMLKQPLMIAYIVAGILAGPLFLNIIHGEQASFHAFSELGVVLLLFLVGLSLDFQYIRKVGRVVLFAGVGQVLFTAAIGLAILLSLGFAFFDGLYLSIAITFSSTIIILKLLADKQELDSVYGRFTVGLLLVQDVIAIVIMILLKTFSGGVGAGDVVLTLIVKAAALVTIVYVLSRVLIPKILSRVASSSEFLFLFTIAWCFGIASAVYWLGFSLEIGAVIAGISLGSSPYSLEISSKLKPLRDFFIVLFFIILGSEMSLSDVSGVVVPAGVLAVFILIGNPIILYILFRLMRFTRRNSVMIGLTAAQVSEFGFILLFTGQSAGLIEQQSVTIFTLVALVTIFISSYIVSYNQQLYTWLSPFLEWFGSDKYRQKEQRHVAYDVWVIGYHRMGWKICESLIKEKKKFAVIDYNPLAVDAAKKKGIPVYFGDISDVEFLSEIPIEKAKLIVSTIHEEQDQLTMIRYIRKKSEKTYIIASLFHNTFLRDLYLAGANYVLLPHLVGGNWMATLLKEKPWSMKTFSSLRKKQTDDIATLVEDSFQHRTV